MPHDHPRKSSPGWRAYGSLHIPAGCRAWRSCETHDPEWDAFLASAELGQFQQSSAWARVKSQEGWQPERCILTDAQGAIIGGFQILWKRKGPVRFGYVTKGPVVPDSGTPTFSAVVRVLQSFARELRLAALIVQPPDLIQVGDRSLVDAGFSTHPLGSVVSATVVVDTSGPLDAIASQYSQSTRKHINRANRAGVTVRVAGPDEAATFFTLMCETCARQQTRPNPSTAVGVRAILEQLRQAPATRPVQDATLLFAEYSGSVVAGIMALAFGSTTSLWKIGWLGQHAELQANKRLYHEAILWGARLGCKRCDLVGVTRSTASAVLAGTPQDQLHVRSSDLLKLRFGGHPALLPEARVWSPWGLGRLAVGAWLARKARPRASE